MPEGITLTGFYDVLEMQHARRRQAWYYSVAGEENPGKNMLLPCVALTGTTDALFKRVGTEIKPFRPSRAVVTTGPYRFMRHPMYVAFIGIALGMGILAGTLVPLFVVVALAWLFRVRYALPEERRMEEQFGEEYRGYCARVRRWF